MFSLAVAYALYILIKLLAGNTVAYASAYG